MPPFRCRIITEYVLTVFGAIIGFGFFILGLITSNCHTVIWGWFSGFCALRVFLMHLSYLRLKLHDNYNPEQMTKLKIVTAYLLLGSIIASAYYLPFAVIYSKSFSILNTKDDIENNYWPSLISSTLSTLWLTLLLINVIIYRKYLLTENMPTNANPIDETTRLLQ